MAFNGPLSNSALAIQWFWSDGNPDLGHESLFTSHVWDSDYIPNGANNGEQFLKYAYASNHYVDGSYPTRVKPPTFADAFTARQWMGADAATGSWNYDSPSFDYYCPNCQE